MTVLKNALLNEKLLTAEIKKLSVEEKVQVKKVLTSVTNKLKLPSQKLLSALKSEGFEFSDIVGSGATKPVKPSAKRAPRKLVLENQSFAIINEQKKELAHAVGRGVTSYKEKGYEVVKYGELSSALQKVAKGMI
ncbi:hypothetical protein FE810_09185 [Thalassotalea litorea]|uniref:Uncharacterized protein n=1 Tax=Thalassotalea litorea TaxID=2020715 RepID=A0A5R9IHS4_9GAMM|nr:hypothetical protein [Thalassotalea litorea]TLU65090.1 hypothetical protein FE810_09185 [Thalassotalea litorea]